MSTTFLFLDMENITPDDLSSLNGGSVRIKVFFGPHQTKVPLALARGLQSFGPHAEYIQMQGIGHNALDFHIAYYLGRMVVQHPTARFVIVSKDAGFDPLISHLRGQKVACERLPSIMSLCLAHKSDGKSGTDRVALVVEDLTRRQAALPRTLRTLRSTVQALFQKKLNEEDLTSLLAQLNERGVYKVMNGKLTYGLPKEPPEGL